MCRIIGNAVAINIPGVALLVARPYMAIAAAGGLAGAAGAIGAIVAIVAITIVAGFTGFFIFVPIATLCE